MLAIILLLTVTTRDLNGLQKNIIETLCIFYFIFFIIIAKGVIKWKHYKK